MENQDNLLRLVAKLYYLDDLGQDKISEIVGISRSKVSRMLSKARERGVVRISVDPYDSRDRTTESELIDRFHLRNAFVIRSLKDSNPNQIRRAIGYFGAALVSELLRSNMVIGLAGGRTIFELVSNITPTGGTQGITAVQLMGNIGPDVTSVDAIELCRKLAEAFHGSFYTLNAPVHAPDPRTRDALLSHEHVSTVWKLYSVMQIAMVGIGSLSDSVFIDRGKLNAADVEKLLAKNAVGEICGRYFNLWGEECDTDYRNRVISIGLDELKNTPEVIGITSNGKNRADAIYAAASSGLVKSLVLDDRAAEAVLARANSLKRDENILLGGIHGG